MTYKEDLQNAYKEERHRESDDSLTKDEYICESLFELYPYDSDICTRLVTLILGEFERMLDGSPLPSSGEGYELGVIARLFPFVQDRIDIGTSIRSAWVDDYSRAGQRVDVAYGVAYDGSDVKQWLRALIAWRAE